MSKISKKKLLDILKKDHSEPKFDFSFTQQQLHDLYNDKKWLKGYNRWKKQQEEGGF